MRAWLAVLVGVACACVFSVRGDGIESNNVPFSYLDKTEPWLNIVTMGPSAWICGSYKGGETWEIYDLINQYINSMNSKNMTLQPTTWPRVRSVPITAEAAKDLKKSSVCHYIERELQSDVPLPLNTRLFAVPKIPMGKFYMKKFWGRASENRIQHYVQRMLHRMKELNITNADTSFYVVANFDGNMNGIMFKITE